MPTRCPASSLHTERWWDALRPWRSFQWEESPNTCLHAPLFQLTSFWPDRWQRLLCHRLAWSPALGFLLWVGATRGEPWGRLAELALPRPWHVVGSHSYCVTAEGVSLRGLNGTVHVNKYLLNEKNISGGIKEAMLSALWLTVGSAQRQQQQTFLFFREGLGGWMGSGAEGGRGAETQAPELTRKNRRQREGGWLAAGALTPTLYGAEAGSSCVCAHVWVGGCV